MKGVTGEREVYVTCNGASEKSFVVKERRNVIKDNSLREQ